jgi:hypothetical protein
MLYAREHDGDRLLVAFNLSDDASTATIPGHSGRVLLSCCGERKGELEPIPIKWAHMRQRQSSSGVMPAKAGVQ